MPMARDERRSSFPQGTSASLIMPNAYPDGQFAEHPRHRVHRWRNGPAGDAGAIAPEWLHYCAELSLTKLSRRRHRSALQPALPVYVENFLGFPVGTAVPAGYDRQKGQWIASADGRVIKVLSINNNLADLDTDGDAAADNATKLATLGVTVEERARLAQLYAPGQTLWRVPISHFSPWDFNWPYALPPDAIYPPDINPNNPVVDRPNKECGSVIDCETQSLGESVPVTGTSWRLHYQSQRTPGRKSDYTFNIPVSGAAAIPDRLQQMRVEVSIAGRLYQQRSPPRRILLTP
jgi:hypothetical protein